MLMTISSNRREIQLKGNQIEFESFRTLAGEIDLTPYTRSEREVLARIIHSCADPSMANSICYKPTSIAAAITLVQNDAVIITDTEMVRHALYSQNTKCALNQVVSAPNGKTRTQHAMEIAAKEHPIGTVFVIGCAPTALFSIIELANTGEIEPGAIIALPVGYVGAARSKELLCETPYEYITNRGPRGGSAITAAAFNAIARMAAGQYSFEAATTP